jgi:hypothetical protein
MPPKGIDLKLPGTKGERFSGLLEESLKFFDISNELIILVLAIKRSVEFAKGTVPEHQKEVSGRSGSGDFLTDSEIRIKGKVRVQLV